MQSPKHVVVVGQVTKSNNKQNKTSSDGRKGTRVKSVVSKVQNKKNTSNVSNKSSDVAKNSGTSDPSKSSNFDIANLSEKEIQSLRTVLGIIPPQNESDNDDYCYNKSGPNISVEVNASDIDNFDSEDNIFKSSFYRGPTRTRGRYMYKRGGYSNGNQYQTGQFRQQPYPSRGNMYRGGYTTKHRLSKKRSATVASADNTQETNEDI
ncbi:hypothetical protein ACF0H5_008960 [Mactra antiquata]